MAKNSRKKPIADDLEPDHDPQAEHVEDMQGEGDEGASDEEEHLVRTVEPRVSVNAHVLDVGTVIRMKASDIANHRERGVALEDVEEDYDGEVYDCSELAKADEEAA